MEDKSKKKSETQKGRLQIFSKKYHISPVRFADKVSQAIAFIFWEISDNCQLEIVIWEFLKDFTGQSCTQVKEIFIEIILIYNQPVASLVAHIGHQVECILNLVDNEVFISQFSDGNIVYGMEF